jgi:hypothetical protein
MVEEKNPVVESPVVEEKYPAVVTWKKKEMKKYRGEESKFNTALNFYTQINDAPKVKWAFDNLARVVNAIKVLETV